MEVVAQNVQFLGRGKAQEQPAREEKADGGSFPDEASQETADMEDFSFGSQQDEKVPF